MDKLNEIYRNLGGVARWQPAAWLRITGEDALTFLQGQFTQELRSSAANAVRYGLWLNQKGRLLADSWVLAVGPQEFRIVSLFSSAAVIRERLESYIIADDVAIEDETAAWAGVSLVGVEAEAALRSRLGDTLPTPGEFRRVGDGFIFAGRRAHGFSWEWLAPVGAEPVFDGLPVLADDDLARLRVAHAIPAVPVDLGAGDLPNEGRLETDAISYTKGCYLGQEVMARLKAMGQVRRRLVRVAGSGAWPAELPAGLFAGPKRVGELRSAVADGEGGFVGFAMVNLLGLVGTTALAWAPESGGLVQVRAEDLA